MFINQFLDFIKKSAHCIDQPLHRHSPLNHSAQQFLEVSQPWWGVGKVYLNSCTFSVGTEDENPQPPSTFGFRYLNIIFLDEQV